MHQLGDSINQELEHFYENIEYMMKSLPKTQCEIITGKWNATIGTDNTNYEEVMGKKGIGKSRGECLLAFMKIMPYVQQTPNSRGQATGNGNHSIDVQKT